LSRPLLSIRNLELTLGTGSAAIPLVRGAGFDVAEGEMLGLVGESGSGKSLTCRAVMQLLPPTIRMTGGVAEMGGRDLLRLPQADIAKVRGPEIGMIFQNPSTYLDPVIRIGDQIGAALRVHQGMSRREALREAVELLQKVGISDPKQRALNYPHEFSGGMRQRAMIAAALACRPKLLIADEPTTALDVTIQAQILRLLLDLRDQYGLSIILITHDLSVVSQTCDRIVVLYGGQVMETASKADILGRSQHPYTIGLIGSQPELTEPGQVLPSIPGYPPGPNEKLLGCRFAPRCTYAKARCHDEPPVLQKNGSERQTACHFWQEVAQ
jgi:peptide/nickel transport system ATP-binding protein